MRILQLTAHYYPNLGGVETHLTDLVMELDKRNNVVFVLTYSPLTTKTNWRIYEKINNIEIFRIHWISGFFYTLVKHPILEFIYLFPGLFIILPFVILIFRPKIIHSHGLVAGSVGVFWGKIFNLRTVISIHNIYHFPKSGFYTSFVKNLFNNADKVLTLSNQSKSEIEKLVSNISKIQIFTSWIDLNIFKKVSKKDEVPQLIGKFVVMFVGRLVEEKGILVLLNSALSWNNSIYLIIIGNGPLKDKVEHYSKIRSNILFFGKKSQSELPKYYSSADLLIVPSIHEEGFGRVISESLACGTPVVASNRGGIPEVMDRSVGVFIDVSEKSIKETIEFYFHNPSKLLKLSYKTRKFAEKRFGKSNIDAIITSYE